MHIRPHLWLKKAPTAALMNTSPSSGPINMVKPSREWQGRKFDNDAAQRPRAEGA